MSFAFDRPFVARALRLAAVAAFAVALAAPAAPAQEGGFGGFFQQLFGGGQPPRPPDAAAGKPKKKVRDFVPATTTREPGTPGGAAVQPTFFIDVLGDSLASLTASGLTEAFADKPEIAVADKSHDASGLVRADYFDWPKAAHDLATGKDHIDFVVVMVGINDLQAMRDGADNLDPLSDRWKAAYAARIDAVLAPFQAANIPVAWVGMPPMRTDRFNADIVKLNEIDRARSREAGREIYRHLGRLRRPERAVRRLRPQRRRADRQAARPRRHSFHQGRRTQGRRISSRRRFAASSTRGGRRTRPPTCRPTSSRRRATSTPRSDARWGRPRGRRARRRWNRPNRSPGRSCR